MSPEPLCVIIPAATLSFCASTLNNSTSLRVVFKVVKSPFAVRLPPITKLPLISAFPFKSKLVAVTTPAVICLLEPPIKGPENPVAVTTPATFIPGSNIPPLTLVIAIYYSYVISIIVRATSRLLLTSLSAVKVSVASNTTLFPPINSNDDP